MNRQAPLEEPVQRFLQRLALLQGRTRRLPKTATMSDLATPFVELLGQQFSSCDFALFHRRALSEQWELLFGCGAALEPLLVLPDGDAVSALHESSDAVCITQQLADRSYVGIVVSHPGPAVPGSGFNAFVLKLLACAFDNAYQDLLYRRSEKELLFSLNHRVLQLSSLIDTGIEIEKLDRKVSPLHLALERAVSLTNASRGTAKIARGDRKLEEISFPSGSPVLPAPDSTTRIGAAFEFAGSGYSIELFEKESRLGVQPFEETDQLLLDALARQVHASLENRSLLEQILQKQRLEHDIAVAAEIQRKILPGILPAIAGYEISGINVPSVTVGGDYYDCIPLPDGRFALVIADVAGKGVSAALLVSTFQAYIRAFLSGPCSLLHLAHSLNRVIGEAATNEKFITAFIALLAPGTGELESLNAGHTPAYRLRNGKIVEELGIGGVPFGMIDGEFPYQIERSRFGPGDRLLLYTDGITEAMNIDEELYDSRSPLAEFLARHNTVDAETFTRKLLTDIRAFIGEAPQSDDITALYLVRH